MKRKLKSPKQQRLQRSYKVRRCFHRDFRSPSFNSAELSWVDQILRSFNEVAPPEWLPAQYQSILQQNWQLRKAK